MTISRPQVPQLCPVCGKPWWPWAGSKLSCHARCYFPPAEQDAIYERFAADPKLTERQLAVQLGVSFSVLRATLKCARKRAFDRSLS